MAYEPLDGEKLRDASRWTTWAFLGMLVGMIILLCVMLYLAGVVT